MYELFYPGEKAREGQRLVSWLALYCYQIQLVYTKHKTRCLLMSNKWIKRLVILLVLTVIPIVFLLRRPSISLPNTGDVIRVELSSLRARDEDVLHITDAVEIAYIIELLSNATRTIGMFQAMDDSPPAIHGLRVTPIVISEEGEETTGARTFIFTDDNRNERIWNSYVGIYQLDQNYIDAIREIYENYR